MEEIRPVVLHDKDFECQENSLLIPFLFLGPLLFRCSEHSPTTITLSSIGKRKAVDCEKNHPLVLKRFNIEKGILNYNFCTFRPIMFAMQGKKRFQQYETTCYKYKAENWDFDGRNPFSKFCRKKIDKSSQILFLWLLGFESRYQIGNLNVLKKTFHGKLSIQTNTED